MDGAQLCPGTIKNFGGFQDVDERLHEVSRIDGLESRSGGLLGVTDVVIGEKPAREARSICDTGFQFQRDGELGSHHLQRIRSVAREGDSNEKNDGRTINDGSRVRS